MKFSLFFSISARNEHKKEHQANSTPKTPILPLRILWLKLGKIGNADLGFYLYLVVEIH